jgi:hypothetical protein
LAFALEPTPDANHSPPAASSHSAHSAGGIKEELEFFFYNCTIFSFCWWIEQEFQPHLDAAMKQEFQFFFNSSNSSSIPPAECKKNCSWTNLLQSH